MEFGLSDEQRMLAESLAGFLKTNAPLDKIRKVAAIGTGYDAGLWQGLVEQGVTGLIVPEQHGGLGLKILDAAVVAEVLGYAAAPAPFAASLVMAPLALIDSGSPAQQAEWLPRIAMGEIRVGIAFPGRSGQTGKNDVRLDGDRLTGEVHGAIDGGGATHVIVYLPDGRAVLTGASDSGVTATVRKSLDPTRPVFAMHQQGARRRNRGIGFAALADSAVKFGLIRRRCLLGKRCRRGEDRGAGQQWRQRQREAVAPGRRKGAKGASHEGVQVHQKMRARGGHRDAGKTRFIKYRC